MTRNPTRNAGRDAGRDSTLSRMARERQADRAAGRPERGLLTGRGRSARASDPEEELEDLEGETDERLDDDIDDYEDDPQPRPRVGAKRTMLAAIRQVPQYLRLLLGLMRDGRVSRLDRLFVLGAAAYIISPLDFIPDLIPFLGQIDDVYLLVLAVQRLVDNAGRRVLLDHWTGDPRDLADVNLAGMVNAAAFFLPDGIRKRLRGFARGRGR